MHTAFNSVAMVTKRQQNITAASELGPGIVRRKKKEEGVVEEEEDDEGEKKEEVEDKPRKRKSLGRLEL